MEIGEMAETSRRKKPRFFSSKHHRSARMFFGDSAFKLATMLVACNVLVILGLMIYMIVKNSWLSVQTYGLSFLFLAKWEPFPPNPNTPPVFGALPPILGTLVTSAIALLLGVPVSLGIALALSEFTPKKLSFTISFLVELLAAIPSVIYGLWGIYVLIPFLRDNVYPYLQSIFHFLPIFQGVTRGPSILTGGIVLAIMIIPIISAISRDILSAVPDSQREAIIALGATTWERAKFVMSYGKSGIIGAIILGFGRAMGETMAVTMVIGNSFNMFTSLFEPGCTLTSIIANEFTEASSPPVYTSALMEIGLILLILAMSVNALARLIIWRSTGRYGGDSG